MCNILHKPYDTIPEEGIAYKLFVEEEGNYRPFIIYTNRYYISSGSWIKWINFYVGDGFCMFETYKEAKKALIEFITPTINDKIKKVAYRKGLGICTEIHFTSTPIKIIIAKEFQILKD